MNQLGNLLLFNGAYDILCALSILRLFTRINPESPVSILLYPFSKLHITMFSEDTDQSNPVIQRILAYWIFTYGMIRVIAGMYPNPTIQLAAAFTYFIEASSFEFERSVGNTMVPHKAYFVSISSFILGSVLLIDLYSSGSYIVWGVFT